MRCDQRCNRYVAECGCCGCADVGDRASYSKCHDVTDEDWLTVAERSCCRRMGSCLRLALEGRRLCFFGGQVAHLLILAFSAAYTCWSVWLL